MKKLLLILFLLPAIAWSQTTSITTQWRMPTGATDSTTAVFQFNTVPASAWGTTRWFSAPYLNRYFWRKSDTASTLATQYYVTHAPHVFYGLNTFNGTTIFNGPVNTFGNITMTNGTQVVQASGTGVTALDNTTGNYVVLSSQNGKIIFNHNGFPAWINADNLTAPRYGMQLPDKDGTFAMIGDIPTSSNIDSVAKAKADSVNALLTGASGIYRDGNAFKLGVNPLTEDVTIDADINALSLIGHAGDMIGRVDLVSGTVNLDSRNTVSRGDVGASPNLSALEVVKLDNTKSGVAQVDTGGVHLVYRNANLAPPNNATINIGENDPDGAPVSNEIIITNNISHKMPIAGGNDYTAETDSSYVTVRHVRTLADSSANYNSILTYGGVADNATDNTAALAATKTAIGHSYPIYFPQNSTNTASYYFASQPSLAGYNIKADPGVILNYSSVNTGVLNTINLINPIKIYARDRRDTVRMQQNTQLPNWYPAISGIDKNEGPRNYLSVLTTGLTKNGYNVTSDATIAGVSSLNANNYQVTTTVNTIAASAAPDSLTYDVAEITTPIVGRQYSAAVGLTTGTVTYTTGGRVVALVKSSGVEWMTFAVSDNRYYISSKKTGVGIADTTLSTIVTGGYLMTAGANLALTVRVIGLQTVEFYVNNKFIRTYTLAGNISSIGFGMNRTLNQVATCQMYGWTSAEVEKKQNQKKLNIALFGDSWTTPEGSSYAWWSYMRDALIGQTGISDVTFTNFAVAGKTAAQQYATMSAQALSGYDYTVFLIGVNDVSSQTAVTTYRTALVNAATYANAQGTKLILATPYMTIDSSLTHYGLPFVNYNKGAYYREMMAKVAKENNVMFVDNSDFGDVQANNVLLRDNLHAQPFYYSLIGKAIARPILRDLTTQVSIQQTITKKVGENIETVLSAIPTTGYWRGGDIVRNSAPATNGVLYWYCSVAGVPGTWNAITADPATTTGDIIYNASASTKARLGIGATNSVIQTIGGIPAWVTNPILTPATVNGLTISSTTGTLTLANGSSLITAGAFPITFTSTASSGVTVPTSGTLYGTKAGSISSANLLSSITDETGTGSVVFSASPAFTGTPSLPTGTTGVTQSAGNSTTALATTAFVTTADNLKANLASPAFTGLLTAPNYYSTSSAPSIAVGANIGSGGTVSIVGNNQDGIITVNTGTGATNGVLCTVTMSGGFAYPNSCTPVITHSTGPAITGDVTVTPTATTWQVSMNGGVVDSSTYTWTYHNGGY